MIKRIATLLTAVTVTCVGLAATPAQASTRGALFRCGSHQTSDFVARVVVPGTNVAFVGGGPRQDPRTPLRNLIRPGDVVGIFATGQVSYGGFFGSAGTWGPDGNGGTAPLNSYYPFPGGPQYALAGKWNNTSSNVQIGSLSSGLGVPEGGDGVAVPWGLWLQPNDDRPLDNSGSYTANVHVWAADRSS